MLKRLTVQVALVLGLLAVVVFIVKPLLEHPHGSVPGVVLTDLQSVTDLQTRFNQDAGVPRLILLLSPT